MGRPAPSSSDASRDLTWRCPRCTRRLEEATGADLACAACQGVFVDHADFASRIESERPRQPPSVRPLHARSRPSEPTVRYGRCPRCGTVMERLNFGRRSGIVVDACREHGTWFDQGELDAALEFVRDGGLEGEGDAMSERAPGSIDLPLRGALEAELSAEMAERRAAQKVTRIADDLLAILFGSSNRSVRRWP